MTDKQQGRYVIELHTRAETTVLEHFRGTREACRRERDKYRKLHGQGEGTVNERWVGPA